MPLNRPPLTEAQIATLRAWIDQGARAPADERPAPPQRTGRSSAPSPTLPRADDDRPGPATRSTASSWPGSSTKGSLPSPEADRATLIRRLSLDLIGLPPTPGGRRLLADDRARRLRAASSTACSPRRTSASAGRGPGSTWPATPTPTATASTPPARSGSTATGSSTPSTATCPSTEFTIDQLAGDLRPTRPWSRSRHRLPPQHADQPGGGDRPRAVPRRVDRRPRQHDRHGLARPDARLRPVPRPQVRPDRPARVLPALRLLQQRRRAESRSPTPRSLPAATQLQAEIARLPQEAGGRAPRDPGQARAPGKRRSSPSSRQDQPPRSSDAFDAPPEKRTPSQKRGADRAVPRQ